jgi:hypothetical protein
MLNLAGETLLATRQSKGLSTVLIENAENTGRGANGKGWEPQEGDIRWAL